MTSTKIKCRDVMKRRREALSNHERKRRSEWIQQTLRAHPLWEEHHHIATYVSVGSEVDTYALIEWAHRQNKDVYVPRCRAERSMMDFYHMTHMDQLQPGSYGILEPDINACARLQASVPLLMIVPGLAFDSDGARIGYGGGYYDRFLLQWGAPVTTVALAFHFQVVTGSLPVTKTDMRMDWIITDQKMIKCEGQK